MRLCGESRAAAGLESAGASFNWLLTERWMLTVPRGAEASGPVSANAMGFAGTFFVRSQEELDYVKGQDPMDVLAALGKPW